MFCKRLRIVAAGAALGVVAATFALSVDTQALLAEAQAREGAVALWLQSHPLLGAGVFLVCTTFGTLTPFPGALLIMLASGMLFGSIGGGLLSVIGVTSSACLVCVLGRRLFATRIEKALVRYRAGAIEALGNDAFNYLLALRLLPGMPAWLTNLLPVPLPIPLRTVLVATSLGVLPICLVAASIGHGVAMLGAEQQPLSTDMLLRARYLAPLVGLALLAVLPPLIKRMRKATLSGQSG
jgi:uncharacterized membrane protein YdjX (TVP38/TMEM64 family)